MARTTFEALLRIVDRLMEAEDRIKRASRILSESEFLSSDTEAWKEVMRAQSVLNGNDDER